jgi:hypothetical protein
MNQTFPSWLSALALACGLWAAAPAWAQCKDCGCKAKCSPECKCQHDEKSQAQ